MELFEASPVLENNRNTARMMREAIAPAEQHPNIGEIRQTGMILAMEMVADRESMTSYDWQERRGMRVYQHALDNGVLLRPIGNVVYFMPPYVINEDEIALMADVALRGIDLATSEP